MAVLIAAALIAAALLFAGCSGAAAPAHAYGTPDRALLEISPDAPPRTVSTIPAP